ncbi:MAG: hypothetical protein RH942_13405 [Kiloniellaceae bacterium]
MDPLEDARESLEAGEHLVWAERPDPGLLARSKVPQVIRGVLGVSVISAFLWLSLLPNWPGGGKGMVFVFFITAGLIYCLWLIATPVVAKTAAGRTVYAATDRRLFIRQDWPFRRMQSFLPGELDDPQVTPALPGRGTVVFMHHKLPWWRRSAGSGYRIEAFYGIPDAQRVAEQIDALKAGQQTPAPDEEA